MPRYDVVLFDADNTLFDFDRSEREALAGLLRAHGLPGGAADVALYHKINPVSYTHLTLPTILLV